MKVQKSFINYLLMMIIKDNKRDSVKSFMENE